MVFPNSQELLKKLKKDRALCAFNFSTPEVAAAIVAAAVKLQSPFILATSESEAKFLSPEVVVAISQNLKEKYNVNFSLHLDHAKEINLIESCLKAGYSSIHIDGSLLPYADNVRITQQVVALCRPFGVSVEGEIGQIPGTSSAAANTAPVILTNPKEAREFGQSTGVDFLAVSIGETHGFGQDNLLFDLLSKITQSVKIPLVLHGGSGVTPTDLKKAVSLGIRKINFNTELRAAWTRSLQTCFKCHPQEIVPYKILSTVTEPIQKIVTQKIKICTL